MVELYTKLIANGKKTINDVPSPLKDAVLGQLKELGYEA